MTVPGSRDTSLWVRKSRSKTLLGRFSFQGLFLTPSDILSALSDKYYKPGRPILFYTGNEGDIMMFYSNTGFMFELAQKWGALVIFAEHRYYGESLPFGKDSFTNKNMQFLTVEQALADYAELLTWFKEQNPQFAQAPILSFGGTF